MLRAEAQKQGARPWGQLCTAVNEKGLDIIKASLLEGIRKGNADTTRGGALTRVREDSTAAATTVVMRSDPKERASNLSREETEELDGYMARGKSNAILVEKARLLTDAAGSTLTRLHQGGRDLGPVAFATVGKEYISNVREEVYKENSLRAVPEVALLKLMTMKMG